MTPGGLGAAGRLPRPWLTERHVLALSLVLTAGFVAAALGTVAWTLGSGGGTWAALHLALAGAATIAIGAFMPHFAVTLSGTRPSAAPLRLATQLVLAAGAATVVVGVALAGQPWPMVGTLAVLVGLAGVAAQTFAPLREPLARRHPIVSAAYGLALGELALGVVLGGLGAAGVAPVVAAWDVLRPAHAWLTLFGAISLTIFATLVYLAPTILGARIRPGWGLALAVTGIGVGPLLAAAGFALESPPIALGGAALALAGAVGQIQYVLDCLRRRGRFTSEQDWRSVAVGHLLAGPFWFAAAVGVALASLAIRPALSGWSIGALAIPLVAGWMLQELVGSWTHLAPAVTPGGPEVHVRQRRLLAAAARTRLIGWNVAVGLLWVGAAVGIGSLAVLGGAALAAALLGSIVMLLRALAFSWAAS